MIATAAITCIMCKHAKLKALVTDIAFQPIKGQKQYLVASMTVKIAHTRHKGTQLAALTLMIIGLIFFILATTRKCRIFRGNLFSNTIMVMLFFSDDDQYVPVKLCKTAGSIHLFKILGHLTPN